MSVFSIPVTIGIDEEAIAQEIHDNVEKKVVDRITAEVKEIIFSKSIYGKESNDPLRAMVSSQIRQVIQVNEEAIVQEAAKVLAEKMARSKAVRDATKEIVEQMKQEV